ncbi:MAG: T9SS type A sorting domain-containing protein [Bacteroidota bacterium]|nr:T9SS type A sorting domain-containing protein [Bacteroidota bacterium]
MWRHPYGRFSSVSNPISAFSIPVASRFSVHCPTSNDSYALPEETFVRIRVLDSYGRRVRSLVDAVKPAGSHRVEFDGSDLPSGIYIYRLEAGDRRISRTMTLLK